MRSAPHKVFLFHVLWWFLLSPAAGTLASNEDTIDSNLSLLTHYAGQMAEEIVAILLHHEIPSVSVMNMPPADEAGWLLESQLLPAVFNNGIEVNLDAPPHDSGGVLIEYKITGVSIEYSPLKRRLFKNAKIERHILFRVFFKLSRHDGTVIWSKVLEKQSKDAFFSSQLSQVNNPNFSFAFSELPAASGVKRLIEPAIAIGVTGTIIYLFYAFRSK